MQKGLIVSGDIIARFDEFAANLNRISLALEPMELSRRCGYASDTTIILKAIRSWAHG